MFSSILENRMSAGGLKKTFNTTRLALTGYLLFFDTVSFILQSVIIVNKPFFDSLLANFRIISKC